MQVFETEALGQTIRAKITRLDAGLDVGVYGGQYTHAGAVTLAEADGRCRTLLREGHSDDAVSERFAAALAARFGLAPSGGSDYHGLRKPDIALGSGRGGLCVPYAYLAGLKALAGHERV